MKNESNSPLYKFWERTHSPGQQSHSETTDWNEQVLHLSRLGIGTEDALRYLYQNQPTFESFMDWVSQRAGIAQDEHSTEDYTLTKEDLNFWDENGFLVVKNAVPLNQCLEAQNAIWEFLGADPANPQSWYMQHPGQSGMMLRFFQHPALDKNRRAAKIRSIYQQLYGETEIYLLIDKVSFNAPETVASKFKGSPLHWDVSLQTPIPFELQGLLYLNDVSATDGAFHCVPGFHREIDAWLAGLPEGVNPREAALSMLKPIPVPGNAGDLVIWHQALPHCATPNVGTLPRMVQYIAYKPVNTVVADIWT